MVLANCSLKHIYFFMHVFRLFVRATSDEEDHFACFACPMATVDSEGGVSAASARRPLASARLVGPPLPLYDADAEKKNDLVGLCFTFWYRMEADVATKGKIGELRVSDKFTLDEAELKFLFTSITLLMIDFLFKIRRLF
jgi:hypothetical protein